MEAHLGRGFVPSVEAVGNRGAIGVEEPINRPEEGPRRAPQTVPAGIKFGFFALLSGCASCSFASVVEMVVRSAFTHPTPLLSEISQAGPKPFCDSPDGLNFHGAPFVVSGVGLMTYGIVVLHALIENDLVDELHLMIFPVVLGTGKRVFGETSDKKRFRLAESKMVGDGVAVMIYERPADSG